MIETGMLKENDRLPTEEEISEVNDISRGTIRVALRELTRDGVIVRYPKRGSFVCGRSRPSPITIAGVLAGIGERVADEAELSDYGTQMINGIHAGCKDAELSIFFPKDVLSRISQGSFTPDRINKGYLVIVPVRHQLPLLKSLAENARVPVMVAGARVPGLNYVAVDNAAGIRLLVQQLVESGHTRIGALFPDLNYFDRYERYTSFLSLLTEFGLRINADWIKIVPDTIAGAADYRKATLDILRLEERPTALLAGDYMVCMNMKSVLDEQGVRVPRDMSLVGFDDFPAAGFASPGITTVAQPVRQIGWTAVEKLVETIKHENDGVCQVSLEPKLIIRESVRKIT